MNHSQWQVEHFIHFCTVTACNFTPFYIVCMLHCSSIRLVFIESVLCASYYYTYSLSRFKISHAWWMYYLHVFFTFLCGLILTIAINLRYITNMLNMTLIWNQKCVCTDHSSRYLGRQWWHKSLEYLKSCSNRIAVKKQIKKVHIFNFVGLYNWQVQWFMLVMKNVQVCCELKFLSGLCS